MGLHNSRFLKLWAFLLGLAESVQQSNVFSGKATVESAALASAEQLNNLLPAHIKELFQVHTTEGEGFEGPATRFL